MEFARDYTATNPLAALRLHMERGFSLVRRAACRNLLPVGAQLVPRLSRRRSLNRADLQAFCRQGRSTACPPTVSSAVVTVPGRGAACCARTLACIALVVRQRQPAPLHAVRLRQRRRPETHRQSRLFPLVKGNVAGKEFLHGRGTLKAALWLLLPPVGAQHAAPGR